VLSSYCRRWIRPFSVAMLLGLAAGCSKPPVMQVEGGSATRGKQLIQKYGCVACHAIPGVPHVGANVGPPLSKMGKQVYVAGVIPNMPDELVLWLQNPPAVDPRTAMPDLGISEAEARDIAAYLYTLH
jgi:cytochrome c1